MTVTPGVAGSAWDDALLAAQLLAIDPSGLGGVRLRARAGPVRDRWLDVLRSLAPALPRVRLPAHADADRLRGGLDLAATLRAGRPVAEQGLLERAGGGLLLIPMAERLESEPAAVIGLAMDTGRVHSAVEAGDRGPASARFGVVALDEGVDVDEAVPAGLADRLALHVDLSAVTVRDLAEPAIDVATVSAARSILTEVRPGDATIEALCAAALALGIASLRAPLLAARAACGLAALDGRRNVSEDDLAAAVRLVLVPRATSLPSAEAEEDLADDSMQDSAEDASEDSDDASPPGEHRHDQKGRDESDDSRTDLESMADRVLEAALASIPPGLLEASRAATAARSSARSMGRSGARQAAGLRGRPAGVRRGRPGPNARLNLVETLRAAAPWQRLRASNDAADAGSAGEHRVQVRQDDFRVHRFKQRKQTTTVFVVDASGSSALHRLAEAKGAVELLLADCYVRRDSVALITFRGTAAEVLLPPTRSLVRAKRRLADLPGGGGTPVASGITAALELCHGVLRRGATPVVVMLTDGRANVAADGSPGRERAREDALTAAAGLRASRLVALLVDTSPRPQPQARELADAMGARYIPLPHADAAGLSAAVRAETG
ncbi:magnesium chelatase subunit D [Halomonas denitrificans]|nr:magnesium chelatase subunit D [Halomonas denitrificans]